MTYHDYVCIHDVFVSSLICLSQEHHVLRVISVDPLGHLSYPGYHSRVAANHSDYTHLAPDAYLPSARPVSSGSHQCIRGAPTSANSMT